MLKYNSIPDEKRWILRLYIAGNAPHSRFAVANLEAICNNYLPDDCELEIVDILQDSQLPIEDGIILTPTLLKLSPPPVRKIFGNLRDHLGVLQALGLSGGID